MEHEIIFHVKYNNSLILLLFSLTVDILVIWIAHNILTTVDNELINHSYV